MGTFRRGGEREVRVCEPERRPHPHAPADGNRPRTCPAADRLIVAFDDQDQAADPGCGVGYWCSFGSRRHRLSVHGDSGVSRGE
jgi:hypothetical protein